MILMVLPHASKSEPFEMGINGEDLTFCGFKIQHESSFHQEIGTEAKSRQNAQRRIYKRQ